MPCHPEEGEKLFQDGSAATGKNAHPTAAVTVFDRRLRSGRLLVVESDCIMDAQLALKSLLMSLSD
jgi:hypothetical protein